MRLQAIRWLLVSSPLLLSSAHQTAAPRLVAKVDLTIGGPEENRDAYVFSDIRGLILDPKGRIIVADNKDENIRVFSAVGEHLYTFARSGEGPGDVRQPCCLALSPRDDLWVKEFGNHRYSSFRLEDGRAVFLYSIRGGSNPIGAMDRIAWDPQGLLIDATSPTTVGAGFVRAFLDSTGAAVRRDTIPHPPSDSLSQWRHERCTTQGCSASVFDQPFGAISLRAFGPRGDLARAVSSRYAVLWSDSRGRRIALIQRELEGPELSARERASAERTLDAIARNTGVGRGVLPLSVPRRKAPIRALGFDLDGRLWIVRAVPDGAPNEADIYSRDGQLTAVMMWPSNVRLNLFAVRGTAGIGVSLDSLGTQSVVRFQFRNAAAQP